MYVPNYVFPTSKYNSLQILLKIIQSFQDITKGILNNNFTCLSVLNGNKKFC